jgi:phosphoribosylanthranilate isomerase
MWIKICGNTNFEDSALAVELGADALGFVFAKSKRQVTASQVAAITAALPTSVELIGVFDSADAEEIAKAAIHARLSSVQLHRGYEEMLISRLSGLLAVGVQIIPTLHWAADAADPGTADRVAAELERIAAAGTARRVLIDSKVNGANGGTGVSFDWTAARRVFSDAPKGLELILAGGLRPGNVANAIGELNPAGVDVSSGVEGSVGRKDPERMLRFIQNARLAAKG